MKKEKIVAINRKVIILIKEKLNAIPDFFRFLFIRKFRSEQKYILFIGVYLHGRIPRIAKWVKRKSDYKTILICKEQAYNKMLLNDSFDESITYKSTWGLKAILKRFSEVNGVYHSFGPPYEAAFELINRGVKQKILFDYQDLMVTNFGLNPPFRYMKLDMQKEQKVLSAVDGIVSHSLELQSAKKFYKTKYKNVLFFPNYTDPDNFIETKKQSLDVKDIHIVYAGGVYAAHKDKDYFGGSQFHWLIEKLNHQKIHFHIYPSPAKNLEDIADYFELDKRLEFFHFHQPVPQQELANELSKYDFGILPFFHRTNKRLDDKRFYSTTLKMFNYFEAGLPIIIGKDVLFQNYMGRKYQGGITAEWEDFDDVRALIKNYEYDILVNSIKKNRERLSLKNQISKIVSFYNQLEQAPNKDN